MKIFATRLGFPGIDVTPRPDPFGIRCVGVVGDHGEVPLLLVVDPEENDGASATNVMYRLLPVLAWEWQDFPMTSAIILLQDSMGYFDIVVPTWREDSSRCAVTFTPLRYPSVPPRSRQAFEALYGNCAHAALAHLE